MSTFSDCFNKDDTVSSITFFKSYGGNGLAETSVPESGHDLFQIIGHGCLYFLPVQNESVDDTKLQPTPLRSRHNDSSDEVCFKLALYTMWHGNFLHLLVLKGEKHHKGEVSVSASPVLIESVDGSKLQPTPLRSRHDDSSDEVCFKLALYTMWHGNFCICLF